MTRDGRSRAMRLATCLIVLAACTGRSGFDGVSGISADAGGDAFVATDGDDVPTIEPSFFQAHAGTAITVGGLAVDAGGTSVVAGDASFDDSHDTITIGATSLPGRALSPSPWIGGWSGSGAQNLAVVFDGEITVADLSGLPNGDFVSCSSLIGMVTGPGLSRVSPNGSSSPLIALHDSGGTVLTSLITSNSPSSTSAVGPATCRGVAASSGGHVAMTGAYTASVNLGMGKLDDAKGISGFAALYTLSPIGAIWQRQLIGDGATIGQRAAVDASGRSFFAVSFGGLLDAGNGAMISNGSTSFAVLSYDHTGAPVYTIAFGDGASSSIGGVVTDGTGGAYVCATVASPLVGINVTLPHQVSHGGTDAFVARIDASGSVVWALLVGGTADDSCTGLISSSSGALLVTGVFRDSVAISGTTFTAAGADAYVLGLSTAGDIVSFDQIGGAGDAMPRAIAPDLATGGVWVAGTFNGELDFDGRQERAVAGVDAFALRLSHVR